MTHPLGWATHHRGVDEYCGDSFARLREGCLGSGVDPPSSRPPVDRVPGRQARQECPGVEGGETAVHKGWLPGLPMDRTAPQADVAAGYADRGRMKGRATIAAPTSSVTKTQCPWHMDARQRSWAGS